MKRPKLLVTAANIWADMAQDCGVKPRHPSKLLALEGELNEARLDGDEQRYLPRLHVAALGEYILSLRTDPQRHTMVADHKDP